MARPRPTARSPDQASLTAPSAGAPGVVDEVRTTSPAHLSKGQAAMLDDATKGQLAAYFERITQPIELIASLDDPADDGVEAAWLAEVERRLQEVDRGTAKCEPWEAVRARIAARLHANRG